MKLEKPSLPEWKKLYQAALKFKSVEPWKWMNDQDLFGVQNPKTEEIGYGCVLGQLGELLALNVYLGSEGLGGYKKVASGKISGRDLSLIFTQRTLMASFEDRKSLQKEDLEIIDKLGLKSSGGQAWPAFRSYRPGFYPWFLTKEEAEFLTLALEQAYSVALRFKNDYNLLTPPKQGYYFAKVWNKEKKTWEDSWIKPPPVREEKSITLPAVDKARLEKIKGARLKGRGDWEIDYFFAPNCIKEKQDERPYYPKMIAFADRESYFVIGAKIFENSSDYLKNFIEELLAVFEKGEFFPATVLVNKKDLYAVFKETCKTLGIELKLAGRLNAIQSFKRSLYEHFGS